MNTVQLLIKPIRRFGIGLALVIPAATVGSQSTTDLPVASPLPPDPADWVCPDSRVQPTREQIEHLCGDGDNEPDFGRPVVLPVPPASLNNLGAKNRYDEALVTFINQRGYIDAGWKSDMNWRMTGPYVGKPGAGKSYGVHPAVKIY